MAYFADIMLISHLDRYLIGIGGGSHSFLNVGDRLISCKRLIAGISLKMSARRIFIASRESTFKISSVTHKQITIGKHSC